MVRAGVIFLLTTLCDCGIMYIEKGKTLNGYAKNLFAIKK